MSIDPQEFGEMKQLTKTCAEGINEIKTMFKDHMKRDSAIKDRLFDKVSENTKLANGAHIKIEKEKSERQSERKAVKWVVGIISGLVALVVSIVKGIFT